MGTRRAAPPKITRADLPGEDKVVAVALLDTQSQPASSVASLAARGSDLLLFLLLCGAVRGYTRCHGRATLKRETPAQGHDLVRVGTDEQAI
jgi:hypothetical protein